MYTRGLGAGSPASTFSERTGGFGRRWFDYGRLARLCDSYLPVHVPVDLGKWRRSRLARPVVRVWPWSWTLGSVSRRFGTGFGRYPGWHLFLTWLESQLVSLDGSDGSHVLGFLAGLRSRWSIVDAARRVGPAPVIQMARANGDVFGRHTQDRAISRCPTTSTAAMRRAPRGRCRRGTRRCPAVADVRAEGMRCDRSGRHAAGHQCAKTGNPLTVPMKAGAAGREAGVGLDRLDVRVCARLLFPTARQAPDAPHVLRFAAWVIHRCTRPSACHGHAPAQRRSRMLGAPRASSRAGHADPDSTRVMPQEMLACVLPVPEGHETHGTRIRRPARPAIERYIRFKASGRHVAAASGSCAR